MSFPAIARTGPIDRMYGEPEEIDLFCVGKSKNNIGEYEIEITCTRKNLLL